MRWIASSSTCSCNHNILPRLRPKQQIQPALNSEIMSQSKSFLLKYFGTVTESD
jgi:hypothetical protein